jgi:PAS domain-containing protein
MEGPLETSKLFHLIPYILSTGLSLAILLYAWSKRKVRGARVFWLYMTWETIWLICYLAGILPESYPVKVFWDSAKWIAGVLAIMTIPYFVINYLEYKVKHPRLLYLLLSIIPFLYILVIVTDPFFHLMYVNPEIIQKGVFTEITFDITWIIFSASFYCYLVALGSFVFLIYKAPKTNRFFRAQVIIITVGGLMPILGTVFAMGNGRIFPMNDLSPFFGGVGNLILAWGLFRFRVFELIPIAREVIMETMEDAVIVLDSQDRIVDINQQAFKTLRIPESKVIGKNVLHILKGWQNAIEKFDKPGNFTS